MVMKPNATKKILNDDSYLPVPRLCADCDRRTLKIEYTEEGNSVGKFREKYRCTHCGATGEISGYEHDPQNWVYSGDAIPDTNPAVP